MQLRPNQISPARIGVEFFQKPPKQARPGIIIAPTAFGKSVVIAEIVSKIQDKILVVQPTKELLAQNLSKYNAMGGKAEIFSASFGSKRIGDVTFATIGSIKSIGSIFRQLGFTKMIIDECHLYPRSLNSMLGGFLSDSGITHVLGLTATPLKLQQNMDIASRSSYSKLVMLTNRSKHGNFFKDVLHVAQISEMVELGYWCPLIHETVSVDTGMLRFNSNKSDYTAESVSSMYVSNNVGDIISSVLESNKDRKSIIIFVPSVEEALSLSRMIPNSVAVYGDMDKRDRDVAIEGFKGGRIRVVVNVNVLSVGFDYPGIDMVICARPTASIAWYYQALGRGTRICPGKGNCKIVDISGNLAIFGPITGFQYVYANGRWEMYDSNMVQLTGVPLHEVAMKRVRGTESLGATGSTGATTGVMPFGKHKGKAVGDVPVNYLEWMVREFTWKPGNEWLKKSAIESISSRIPIQQ
jgi:DNA repair protein RadD